MPSQNPKSVSVRRKAEQKVKIYAKSELHRFSVLILMVHSATQTHGVSVCESTGDRDQCIKFLYLWSLRCVNRKCASFTCVCVQRMCFSYFVSFRNQSFVEWLKLNFSIYWLISSLSLFSKLITTSSICIRIKCFLRPRLHRQTPLNLNYIDKSNFLSSLIRIYSTIKRIK